MSAYLKSLGGSIADTAIAGVALLITGGVSLLGIITAEAYHPDYATTQEISDLGSTAPPNPVSYEPTATIFNGTMLTSGALVLVASSIGWGDRAYSGSRSASLGSASSVSVCFPEIWRPGTAFLHS
ncbi:hypothetical protein [Halorubrum sp. FL23]|uniref:hypothetical protein n=1 Tax=Halorubrum sp. FL23 TaxID=3458704 RepID=UPI0040340483